MKRLASSVRHVAFALLFLFMGATWAHAQVNMNANDVASDAPSATVQQAVLPSALSVGVRGSVTHSSFGGDAAKKTQPNMTASGGAFLMFRFLTVMMV